MESTSQWSVKCRGGTYVSTDLTIITVGIVSLSTEEAKALPEPTTVSLKEEGRYIAALDVFHELHCLVSPSIYPPSRFDS